MLLLEYLSRFWRTFEMSLINCEINLDLNSSKKRVIVATTVANQNATFSITDTQPCVPVATLSTQDNAKLPEQLKSGFKKTNGININQKYQQKNKINTKIT